MVNHKYGEFTNKQFNETKELIRKRIFFLLLVAEDLDSKTKFPDVDLAKAHEGLMWKVSGFNELLGCPTELVTVLSLLEEAKKEIELESDFNFAKYRKLILDAGAEVSKISGKEA